MATALPSPPTPFAWLNRPGWLGAVHRWLVTPPPDLPSSHSDFYALSNCTHALGLISHLLFLGFFLYLDLPFLIWFNVGSIALFATTLWLSKSGRLDTALLLGGLEVAGHQMLAVVALGLGPCFQHYMMILAVGTLFYRHLDLRTRVVMAILPVAGYIGTHVYGLHHEPWHQIDPLIMDLLAGLNVTFFVIILMGMCIYFQYYVEEARILAEKLAQSKTLFLANMSHELRTPLNAILGFAQILQRSEALTEQDRRNVDTINRSGGHLLDLINDILDMSKLEEGKLSVETGVFDLHRLLADLEGMFALAARRQLLTLRVSHGPDVPRLVRSDELRLRQVLINLTGNALKFTEHGSVTVGVELLGTDATGRARLRFHVTDTGRGIAREEQGDLFQLFTQTEAGRTSRRGTGLGLALSQRFVGLLGGRIEVESEPGRGSTFSFVLPLEPVPEDAAAIPALPRPAARVRGGGPVRHMLVVDDNAENRDVLLQFLRGLGFAAEAAVDGAEGVAAWQRIAPDLVWMDLRMPVMDGYDACRAICTLAEAAGQPRPPIVAITASSLEGGRLLGEEAGFAAYASKPFRAADLCTIMERLLQVEFEPAPEAASTAPTTVPPTPAQCADLPPELRQVLARAATLADYDAAAEAITELQGTHPATAAALREQLDNYRFDRISEMVGQVGQV